MKKLLMVTMLLSSLSVLAAENKVVLTCKNSFNEKISLRISKADYDFLMFGNNSLKGAKYNISKTKREKNIVVVDNQDSNIESGFYTCSAKLEVSL